MNEQLVGGLLGYGAELCFGPQEALIRANQPIKAGEVVFHLTGQITPEASKYSIQLGENRHLLTENSHWQYVNHGCEPNIRIDVDKRLMIAIRDIGPGEELMFNYNTTEWDMASPFECLCSADSCIGSVRGFRYLTPSQRKALRPWLSPLNKSRFKRTG